MITLEHVHKAYGKGDSAFTALGDISLNIEDGSSIAIVGKSGSGKSTLMHVMSGLDSVTSGKIIIDDTDIAQMKPKLMSRFRASQMSFIFQAFFVEATQTCYQNVMLPVEIARIPRGERKARVMAALKAVELEDKAQVMAANLSGGQKQRLAIARAIVNKPRILFADEPTGNLDSVTGDRIIKLLFNLNKELGCTLILVTHDHDLAALCDQQVTIKDGQLVRKRV